MNTLLPRILMNIRPAPVASFIKKALRIKRCIVEAEEGTFYVDPVSYLGLRLIQTGHYEPEMESLLKSTLKPSSIFVDLGANEGYFSVVASKLCQRVIAIEPQERLHSVIEKNLRLNECSNVSLVKCAVSDHAGEAALFLSPDTNNGSTGLQQTTRYGVPTVSVQTKTLSQVFAENKIDRADLLKIDIEGFEYEAILGSKELFRDKAVRRIALELHPKQLAARGLNSKDLAEFLEGCGYRPDNQFTNLVYR